MNKTGHDIGSKLVPLLDSELWTKETTQTVLIFLQELIEIIETVRYGDLSLFDDEYNDLPF